MTTKSDCLFPKNDQQIFCQPNSDTKYSNLNLNQSNKYSDLSPLQSKSKSCSSDKHSSGSFEHDKHQKEATQSFKKSINNLQQPKPFESLNLHGKNEEGYQKSQLKDKNSIKNSSTLSLHIAAYENSIEAATLNSNSKEDDGVKKYLNISSKFQDYFEIPRQHDLEIAAPEIMQFKASQRLFNPNDMFSLNNANLGHALDDSLLTLGFDDESTSEVSAASEKPNVHHSTDPAAHGGLDSASLSLSVDDDSSADVSTAIEKLNIQSNINLSVSTIPGTSGFGVFGGFAGFAGCKNALSTLGEYDDDGFDEDSATPAKPYVRPPIFCQTEESSSSFGGDQSFKKKRPFSFFTRTGSVSIDTPNGKPPLQPFKGRCYTTAGESMSSKNVEDSFNDTNGTNSSGVDEAFLSWSSRRSKFSKPATGEPSIAPIGYVPKVRALSKIYEDDLNAAKEYERIHDFDEPLVVHGVSNLKTFDTWESIELPNILLGNIQNSMYLKPRQIQRVAMPLIMDNMDILVCSETGSGKTAAFLIPIIASCMEHKADGAFISQPSTPFALIIGPTRELMHQSFEQALKFAKNTGVTVAKLYGEYAVRPNSRELQNGCDLLFTTPGRLHHFFKDDMVFLKTVRYLVFDEGDTLLSNEFIDDIEAVIRHRNFTRKGYYQTMFISATFNEYKIRAATRFMRRNNSASILSKKCATNKLCLQEFQRVPKEYRLQKLKEFLDAKMLEVDMDSKKFPRILIFVNSQILCDELTENLRGFGFGVIRMRGNYAQNLRLAAFEAFRNKTFPIMVCTDLCGRGIDIKDVDLVLNYEMPYYLDTYIYRVGRVGRIREGNCLSFVDPDLNKFIVPEILQVLQIANHPVSLAFDEIVEEAQRLIEEANDPANGFDVFFGDETAASILAQQGLIPF